jgi:hypothetical protein
MMVVFCASVCSYPKSSFVFPNFDFINSPICSNSAVKLHEFPSDPSDDDIEVAAKPKRDSEYGRYEKRSDDPMYRICYEDIPVEKIGNTKICLPSLK